MKTVVFHIGSGKTGSSAIQSGLARYSSELLVEGVFYPKSVDSVKASMGKITSGNSADLLQYLYPKYRKQDFDEDLFIKSFLELILNCNEDYLVFSNEQLEIGSIERWSVIFSMIKSNNIDVKIVYYARHLADHACSVYGQMVKRSCFKKTFDFFSSVYTPKFKTSLSGLLTLLEKEKIIVKIYEECKSDIFNDFLTTFTGKKYKFKKLEQINRSLTSLEVSLLRNINKFDETSNLSRHLSDYLIYNHDAPKEPFFITQKQLNAISLKNKSNLEWLNTEFFKNEPRLKYSSEKVIIKDDAVNIDPDNVLELCALLLCRN